MRENVTACFSKLHRRGYTPFAYHTRRNGERHQHYQATTLASGLIGMGLVDATFNYWWPLLEFTNLDSRGHQAFAGIGLMGMAIVAGMITGTIHFKINDCRAVKDRSDYSVQVAEDTEIPMEDRNTSINETTGLMGQDREGASVYRVGNCHPLRAIYPATPIKTGVWIPMVGLLIFAVATLINPDLFNEFAGNSPISNTTRFTNCTWTDTYTPVCVSVLGYFMGLEISMAAGVGVVAGIGTLFHYAAAKATENCSQDQAINPPVAAPGPGRLEASGK